jgi:hypothetical protein
MKARTAFLSVLTILCLLLAVVPALAQPIILYSNGPINGTVEGWPIDMFSGSSVSDSFFLPYLDCPPRTLQYLHIGVWMLPEDLLMSVQVDIGTYPFGRNIFSEPVGSTGSTDWGPNPQGFDIQQVDFALPNIHVPPGTYWLTLSNALSFGGLVYWDENNGVNCPSSGCPSSAYQNNLSPIPSESFTLTGVIPEPSTILLFGSGILGLTGILRRKLNR